MSSDAEPVLTREIHVMPEIEFLLKVHKLVDQDEERGREVRGPGLPDHVDPKDSRWFSTDCIEPPPVES